MAIELPALLLAMLLGCLLGAFFFGGLWWTVRKSVVSKHAGAWLLMSLLVRMSAALTGFYFVGGGHWQRLVACLVGFIVARLVVTRIARQIVATPVVNSSRVPHAS